MSTITHTLIPTHNAHTPTLSHIHTHTMHTHTYNALTMHIRLHTHLHTHPHTPTMHIRLHTHTLIHIHTIHTLTPTHTHSHSHSSLRNSRPCMSPLFTELIRTAMPHATSLQTKWGPSVSVLARRAHGLFWAHQLMTCDVCHSRLSGCRAWTAHAPRITPQHVSLN